MPKQGLAIDYISARVAIQDCGCWFWTNAPDDKGYGRAYDGTKLVVAHRFVYQEFKGTIPDGLELDHLCRTPSCVNPDHLEPVTHKENMRRGKQAQQTHCVNGHEYNEENTLIRYRADKVTTYRQCRPCVNARSKAQDQTGRYPQRKAREMARQTAQSA